MTLSAMPQEKTVLAPATVSAKNISFLSATQLGEINDSHSDSYRMSEAHVYRTYKFRVDEGQLDLSISGVNMRDFTMALYVHSRWTKFGPTSDIDLITQAVDINDRRQRIQIDGLGRGTYYVVVGRRRPEHVEMFYHLTIRSHPGQRLLEREPNNTASSAHRIGGKANLSLVGQRVMHGSISGNGGDAADFYQFTLTQPSYVQAVLGLENVGSRAVLELLDANTSVLRTVTIARPRRRGDVECDLLPAGTYYTHIRPVGPTNTPYRLTLEGIPVETGKLTVHMHSIIALDDFETWKLGGRGKADFYYEVSINNEEPFTSDVFDERNSIGFGTGPFSAGITYQHVDIEERSIPFSISLFEEDPRNDDRADINPAPGSLRDLSLSYDTFTGEVSGQGLSVHKEGQKITVEGNSAPRARITFEVKYETINPGDI